VVASKPRCVSRGGAAITSADLGGSSSYSNESLLQVLLGFTSQGIWVTCPLWFQLHWAGSIKL